MPLKKEEALWTWGVRAQGEGSPGIGFSSLFIWGGSGVPCGPHVLGDPSRKWSDPISAPDSGSPTLGSGGEMKGVPVNVGDILVAFPPFHSAPLAEHVEAVPGCPDIRPSRHLGILRGKWPFVQGPGRHFSTEARQGLQTAPPRMRLGKEKG